MADFLELRGRQRYLPVQFVVSGEQQGESLRVVCISDTHSQHRRLSSLPRGDVLVHAGDLTLRGDESELVDFAHWYAEIEGFERKICIAGNHDLGLDVERCGALKLPSAKSAFLEALQKDNRCVYLEDSGVDVRSISFWGSPWQPYYCDWCFNVARGEPCRAKWRAIPSNVDVLLTHGPPLGRADLCESGARAGCLDLLEEIQTRIRPKVNIFGHIHEAYKDLSSDGHTDFVNAASCDLNYDINHRPVVIDIPFIK